MRKLAILLLLAGAVPPAFAANPVTVGMVDQLLNYAHGKTDAKVAEQLFDLELTERVSAARLERWEAELPGPKSRQAMVELADASVFLRLPPEEIPGTPAPDHAAQVSLLTLTRSYVEDSIPKLPNFFATRTTTHFSDEPEKINTVTLRNSEFKQMHMVEITSDKAYFREGKEVIVNNKNKQVSFSGSGLVTQGVFGEAMELVLSDIFESGPVWSHWEGSTDAPLAVFRYAVPLERSHYGVGATDASGSSQASVAYQGEIAIDPANGTVLRLTVVSVPGESGQVLKANVMVKYGPVEIGSVSYICPVKSVALAVIRTSSTAPNLQDKSGPATTTNGPLLTKVNDVQFTDYHRFRAESRILTGNDARTNVPPAASGSEPNSTPNP